VRRPSFDEEARASWSELFFDLVFVLAISQLSSLLYDDLTVEGAAETFFLLLVAWSAWIYTTWMTNWFDPNAGPVRVMLVTGMLASLLGAVSIPDAFGDRALLFVAGYVGIQTIRNAFCLLATNDRDPLYLPLVRIFVWNGWVGAIWLAGALVDGEARVGVWCAALLLDYTGPLLGHWTPVLGRSHTSDWDFEPAHFTERIQLFVIIALGEAIVALGRTAADLELTTARLLAIVVSFTMTASLWWLYFDYHADRALEVLARKKDERGRLARDLSYLHIPIVAGIIAAAVASEIVIAHPDEQLNTMELVVVAAGPLLYMLGSLVFKLRVLETWWQQRAVAAALIVLTALLGLVLPALAIWGMVVSILVGLGVIEAASRSDRFAPLRSAQ
jgi:low temperature requirement protein LtrA